MRARLARPRRSARGRLFAPVAAAAAVALVGGVVVAAPDAPTVREDVQATSLAAGYSFNAGVAQNFDLRGAATAGANAGLVITGVEGLPEGMSYDAETGKLTGTAAASGVYEIKVNGTLNGNAITVPVTVTVNNTDGTPPEGAAQAGSAAELQGSLGGQAQAGGQVTTGSDGADTILGAVAGIVSSLGGDAGSVGELTSGSTGGGTGDVEGDTPSETGPLGSLAESGIDLGSIGGGTTAPTTAPTTTPSSPAPESPAPESPTPEQPTTEVGSVQIPGSSGTATGEGTGGIDTQSLGPILAGPLASLGQTGSTGTGGTPGTGTEGEGTIDLGSEGGLPGSTVTGDAETGGEVSVPGSSFDAGSLGGLAPGLAITGAALLGLAGLSLMLNGGSSTPGSTAGLPALPGSSGAVAPTVAAGAPAPVEAPGPTVANGRG